MQEEANNIDWGEVEIALIEIANYLDEHPEERAKVEEFIKSVEGIISTINRDIDSAFGVSEQYLEEKLEELNSIVDSTLKGSE